MSAIAPRQLALVLLFAVSNCLPWTQDARAAASPQTVTAFEVKHSEGTFGSFRTMEGVSSVSEILELLQPGSEAVNKTSGKLQYDNVTLARTITPDLDAAHWRKAVEDGDIYHARRDLTVEGLDENGRSVLTVYLSSAWPSALKVAIPEGGTSVEEQLTIAHEGFVLLLDPVIAIARGIISSPADGAVYYVPSSLPLTVALTENVASAVRVRFLVNDVEIGADTDGSNGFSFSWTAPKAGFYTLKAEIVSGSNETSLTPAIALRIKPQITLGLSAQTIAENQPIKSVVGIFTVQGADTAAVSLAPGSGDTQNSSFSVDSVKRLLTEMVFDHETLAGASIRVRAVATDGIGGFAEQVFTIGIADGPEEAGPKLQENLKIVYDTQSNSTTVDLHFDRGIYGRSYTVEVSGDLKTWTAVGSAVADEGGSFSLRDAATGKPDRRFWRVRLGN